MSDICISEAKSHFAPSRWTEDSPEWQALDRQLAPDHKARLVRAFVDQTKQHRNLRKLHGRGLHRAKAEIGLVVLAQNALMLHRLRQKAVNSVEIAA
jgi:hypothetical protein